MITAAVAIASPLSQGGATNGPILWRLEVNITSGTTASGNNVTSQSASFTDPKWDLWKALSAGPNYTTHVIDGVSVQGYDFLYTFSVGETNGATLAHFVDNVTFGETYVGPGGGGNGAVPEPATWALMILGFGAVGATLRSQRRVFAA